jgi:hypothetical protein
MARSAASNSQLNSIETAEVNATLQSRPPQNSRGRFQMTDRGQQLLTQIEGTLAILGIETIKILIVGLAGGIPATPDLLPAEIIAGIPDVKIVATDVPTAEADVLTTGTNDTAAAKIAAPVTTTEILEATLEVVVRRTVTEIMEAAEAGGRTPEKRGHSDLQAEALGPSPKLLANTEERSQAQ